MAPLSFCVKRPHEPAVQRLHPTRIRIITMKKAILILAMTFVAGLGMSQSLSNYMYSDRGELIYNDRVVKEEQLSLLLSSDDLSTYKSARTQRDVGNAFLTAGWISAGVSTSLVLSGGLLMLLSAFPYFDAAFAIGVLSFYVGVPLFIFAHVALLSTGYMLRSMGDSRLEWIADNFNQSSNLSMSNTPNVLPLARMTINL